MPRRSFCFPRLSKKHDFEESFIDMYSHVSILCTVIHVYAESLDQPCVQTTASSPCLPCAESLSLRLILKPSQEARVCFLHSGTSQRGKENAGTVQLSLLGSERVAMLGSFLGWWQNLYMKEQGNSFYIICTLSGTSWIPLFTTMIITHNHSTYLHLVLDIYLHVTCNCICCLFSTEKGRNTLCTVSTKYQRKKHIWNFERVLFHNCVLVLEYMCIGIKWNRSSSNQLWNSTFHGPICLQM